MEVLVNTIMEKHAFNIKNWWGGLGPVKKYRAAAADPTFKMKKAVGKTVLKGSAIAAPTLAAAHWLDKPEQLPTTPLANPPM